MAISITHGEVYELTSDVTNPTRQLLPRDKGDWRTWKVIPKGTRFRGLAVDANGMFVALVRADDAHDILHQLADGPLRDLIVQCLQPTERTLIDVLCEWHQDSASILDKLLSMGKVSMKEVIGACKVMKHERDAELAAWHAKNE